VREIYVTDFGGFVGVWWLYWAVEVAAVAASMRTVLVLVAVRPFWSVAT
jgi:hypothetical protein